MKILNRVGGAFLLLVLGMAAILGFQSPTGRQVWDDLWAAGSAALSWVQDQIGRVTLFAGHGFQAIGAAALGLVLVLILLKKPISLRAFEILLVLAGVTAFVLWNPSAIQNL
jgi:hypothetical protein